MDGAAVLLHRVEELLVARRHVPHAHPPVVTARHDPPRRSRLIVVAHRQRRDRLAVGVRDHELEASRLGEERTDLAVRPAAHDGLPVRRDADAFALEVRHLDAQQLLAQRRVPDANVVDRAGDEEVAAARREADVVHRAAVARRAQLDVPRHGHVVAVGLVGAHHEAGAVRRHSDRGDGPHHLRAVALDHVELLRDQRHGAVACTDDDVGVARARVVPHLARLDSLAEALLGVGLEGRAHAVRVVEALDRVAVDLELEELSGLGAAVGKLVIVGHVDALDHALHGAHLGIHGV
mmetsp:Transcript_9448/g.23983  ORF Transcript_9448/g.23983 Transcript_9448/m.23983 type:complete len:293 (-) Transcript_9448:657-1535(-)